MANVEFGTGKTVVILSIVAACFAVLWPKILYPVFSGKANKNVNSNNMDGCCDVMFETDINAIKIMNDLCGSILNRQADFNPKLSQAYQQGKLSKEVINTCRTEVMNMCGVDIAEFLNKKEKIGYSYKQMLDKIRSFNISICLRHHFGVNPGLLGAPRRMRIWSSSTPRHLRQERPLHFRPEIIHPALREKGRAIPQSHVIPKVSIEKEHSRPIPIPGIRPTMGGPGHVVPPSKVGGTMSVIMPIYTIGIVLFFTYTVMKIFSRKANGSNEYKRYTSDPEFRRVVFSQDYSNGCAARIKEDKMQKKEKSETPNIWKSPADDSTRLGDLEIDHLRKRLEETEKAMERIVAQMETVPTELMTKTQVILRSLSKGKKSLEEFYTEELPEVKKVSNLSSQLDVMKKEIKAGHTAERPSSLNEPEGDTKPKVKVVGLELMAECEGGQRWSRPATPNLGVVGSSRSATPVPPPYSPEPQNIFLEGALPQQSQLLVTDSKTQTLIPDGDEPEPPVILSSKMTLSLISLDAALPDENIDRDPWQSRQVDMRSECDDNMAITDSTLLNVDSEVIDESGQKENELLGMREEEGKVPINGNEEGDEITEMKSLYTTTKFRESVEASLYVELDDVDVSNVDSLGFIEDREDLQTDSMLSCSGNSKETSNSHATEPLKSVDSQQQN